MTIKRKHILQVLPVIIILLIVWYKFSYVIADKTQEILSYIVNNQSTISASIDGPTK